jgi:hypothetical protein
MAFSTGVDHQVEEVLMACPLCASGRETEFTAEVMVHFSGLENLAKSGVFVFPRVLVCLDCGSCRFTVPEIELALLAQATATGEASISKENLDYASHHSASSARVNL